MPKASPSKLYQRTKALLTPPSSPPTVVSNISPSSSSKMTKPSTSTSTSTTTTILERPEVESGNLVEVPKSDWKQPKKIGTLESWYIFYEGMFAGNSILVLFLTLLALAASYLPGHLRQIAAHARYYAYGTGEYVPHK
ncbi:hypothetical protein JCM5350_004894 [Sporobolomyces pararoseus]